MRKIYHHDSPEAWYHADACVLSCFDTRFELVVRKYLTRRGFSWVDYVKLGGGAKLFASPAREEDRAFVLGQVEASIRLHGTERIILMTHRDCGAYGGSQAFADKDAEIAFHGSELRKAAAWLREHLPDVPVETYFLGFTGVYALAEEAGVEVV